MNNYSISVCINYQKLTTVICIIPISEKTVKHGSFHNKPIYKAVRSCQSHLSWMLKVAFFQKVWCVFQISKKNYSKSLSWTWNLNFPPITVNNKFKFQAQDSNMEYFYFGDLEIWKTNRTFWKKDTFRITKEKLLKKHSGPLSAFLCFTAVNNILLNFIAKRIRDWCMISLI